MASSALPLVNHEPGILNPGDPGRRQSWLRRCVWRGRRVDGFEIWDLETKVYESAEAPRGPDKPPTGQSVPPTPPTHWPPVFPRLSP
jgi:hypothetical protein